ncbi:MAG: hypothetical protein FJW38_16670 [Acidobacteria bacterium]|nr:hypothetical protein [Acidobacteriota bacterium]
MTHYISAVTSNFWVFVLFGLIYLLGTGTLWVLLQGPFGMGLQWATLKQVRGTNAVLNDLGKGFEFTGAAILECLLVTIAIALASSMLFLPGLLLAALLQFPYLLILDRGYSFADAFSASTGISKPHFWKLLWLTVIQLLLLTGGLLLCGVGLVIAVPICYAASAAAYVQIMGFRPETQSQLR